MVVQQLQFARYFLFADFEFQNVNSHLARVPWKRE